MKIVGFCLAIVATLAPAAGQAVTASRWEVRRKLYPELMKTFNLAESAPAPLRALAQLRIASFPGLKDQEWKRELLDESFEAAAQSPTRWPVDDTIWGLEMKRSEATLSRILAEAFESNSGLDRLTLQTSAVRAMLAVDKQEARKLFESISPPELSPLTCSDSFTPKVDAYYETAGQLAKNGFTLREQKQREHLDFLFSVVASISSGIEVRPAAQMLLDLRLPQNEAGPIVAAFARRLESISSDSRSFFANMDSTSGSLMKLSDSLDESDALAMLKSWRTYLVKNLTDVRCAVTVDPKSDYARWATNAVNAFNVRAARLKSLLPIEQDDIRAGKVESSLPEVPTESSEQEDALRLRGLMLTFGDRGQNLSDGEKNTLEWKTRFDDYMNAVENLELANGSGADLIWEKCQLFGWAAVAAPPGPMRDRAVERYTALLKISNIPPEMVPRWYGQVRSLIDLLQSLYKDRESVLKSFENSGDPLLSLVAEIYRLQ